MKSAQAQRVKYLEAVEAHRKAKAMYKQWESSGHAPDSPIMRQLYNRMIRCQEKAQELARMF